MRHYTAEFKEQMLKKVFSRRNDTSVTQIAQEANMPARTLRGWIQKSEIGEHNMTNNKYSNDVKFKLCIKYFSLPEEEKGAFLRSKGLHSYELENWQKDFINSASKPSISKTMQEDKKRIKNLERELKRKEKALAETATLLTLKKKYLEIFESEE